MLPGLILKQSDPFSAASIALLKWKWISATIGIGECFVISFRAWVDSSSGHETLTISPPTSAILPI